MELVSKDIEVIKNKKLKKEIRYNVPLDNEQLDVKSAIMSNQIVVVTGRSGSGKSLVIAQSSLDLLFKKEVSKILITRANIVTGRDMGYLPGNIDDKLNPYLEAFKENLIASAPDVVKLEKHIQNKDITGLPIAYIRGKTINDVLVVEEAQNLTKHEMQSILTRLGKYGKILINGDNDQKDTKIPYSGLSYVMDLSKEIDGIKHFNLINNHRSDLVGEILNYEYEHQDK